MEEQNIASKKLEETNKLIEEYVKKLGVHIVANGDDITHYFSMTSEQLQNMTAEECDTTALLLSQKSCQIQNEINYHNRIKNWANENINAHISDKLARFGDQYTKFEAKKIMAIQETEYTKKLYAIWRTSQAYLDTLDYLPIAIKNHADLFVNLAKSKRRTQ